jgi:hypothetical protein
MPADRGAHQPKPIDSSHVGVSHTAGSETFAIVADRHICRV